jgi:hypothetical protein
MRKIRLDAFGFEVPLEPHGHRFDMIWEKNGVLPPCRRKPGDPYYETPR